MSEVLDEMAAEVAEDQAAIESQSDDTRTRVIRMGKKLQRMQKEQKKEQKAAKARGEEPQPWKEWMQEKKSLEETFPSFQQGARYSLIARYPKAYEKGMSIDQAYRAAGQWKRNNGNPPDKEKKTFTHPLVLIGKSASPLERRVKQLNGEIASLNVESVANQHQWDSDAVEGCKEALQTTVKECRLLLNHLNKLEFQSA